MKIAPRDSPTSCSSRATVAPSYPWRAKARRAPSRIWRRRAALFGNAGVWILIAGGLTVGSFLFIATALRPEARIEAAATAEST